MARIRSIKPEFFESRSLAKCSRDARIVFAGLFTLVDDYGKIKDLPKKLVGELFPHDVDVTSDDMDRWLREVEEVECIIRYQVDDERLVMISNFSKHQVISKKGKSRLPDPPSFAATLPDAPEDS